MKVRKALKFIGDVSALLVAIIIVLGLIFLIGAIALILLALLGWWIGIGNDIFVYLASFCIFCKACDVLAWIVGKIAA